MKRMTLTFFLGFGLSLSACDSDDSTGDADTDSGTASGTTTTGTATATASDSDAASDTAESESDSNSGPESTSSTGGQESSSGGSSGSSGSTGFGSSGSSGSGSSGSSSSGGGDDGLYGPCPADQACEGDYQCVQVGGGPNAGANWCTQGCNAEKQDCPAPSEGDAEPFCRGQDGEAQCLLSCTGETTCPTGMECVNLGGNGGGGNGVCVFPADF